MIKKILFFYVQLSCLIAVAQPENPIFYRIYADYGMSSDKTTVVHQDYLGYIWIGTEEGLNRFINYYDFEIMKASGADSSSISSDFITAIIEDKQNGLWIGTKEGLNKYDRANNTFSLCLNSLDSKASINALHVYNNQIYVGMKGAVIAYDITSGIETMNYVLNDEQERVLSIVDFNNKVLIGTSSSELYAIGESDELELINRFDSEISVLKMLNEKLWIGTQDQGVFILNEQMKITDRYSTNTSRRLTSNKINDIEMVYPDVYWISTDQGLNELTMSTSEVKYYTYDFNNYLGISDHEIRDIFKDSYEALWMTTAYGGVSYYHQADNQFSYLGQKTNTAQKDELLDYNVLSMYHDTLTNELVIGSRVGISLFNEQTEQFKHVTFSKYSDGANNPIFSIALKNRTQLWLGTKKGLFSYNREDESLTRSNIDEEVTVVYPDKNGVVWIGTKSHGLKKFGPNSGETLDIDINLAEGQKSNAVQINDIREFAGELFVGTTKGLYVYKKGMLNRFILEGESPDKESNATINFLKIMNDQLLVGTRQKGLFRLNKKNESKKIVNKKGGLPSDDVRSVVLDSKGYSWLSTNSGLSKLEIFKDTAKISQNYYVLDGLQSNLFTEKAAELLNNGKIYLGGLSGVTFFDPLKVRDFNFDLTVALEKLLIDGKVINPKHKSEVLRSALAIADTLYVPADAKSFTMQFQAIDYIRPDSIKYAYQLTGYDNEWIATNKRNSVTYTSLPANNYYTFQLKAKSRLRNWSPIKSIVVFVKPHFYERIWFKLLALFISLIVLIFFFRIRDLRNTKKRKQLAKLVAEKTKELEREIKEKERTAKELEIAKNEAEKANRIKGDFLANISHEIRTPLNGILGLTNLVIDDKPKKEHQQMLQTVSKSAESLKTIINDLLDLSKIEAGKFEISLDKFNLKKSISELYDQYDYIAQEKGIMLELEYLDNIPNYITGDEQRLKQVLTNLLSNALKFTEKGSIKVEISCKEIANQKVSIVFGVHDTGIGIPIERLDDIFESFTQIDNSSKRQFGGTGLGLAITKELTNLMGGEIRAQSNESKGSKFIVKLPFDLPEDQDVELEELYEITYRFPERRSILLVEDNLVNIMVASKMLLKRNQLFDVAKNGMEAIEMLKNKAYDMVLMDIQMPVMDGFEATERIRNSNSSYKDIPIIALTAGAMKMDREKSAQLGMNDFLSKPLEIKELDRVLSIFLNSTLRQSNLGN